MLFIWNRTSNRRLAPVVIVALLTSSIIGCSRASGPPRYGISGTVKLNGEPVNQGSIRFDPMKDTKGSNAGDNIEKGAYRISPSQGLVKGRYRVEIRSNRKTGRQIPAGSPFPPGTMVDEVEEAIPAEYNVKSTLECTITDSGKIENFDLVDKKPAK
jgi:hypothetical protein